MVREEVRVAGARGAREVAAARAEAVMAGRWEREAEQAVGVSIRHQGRAEGVVAEMGGCMVAVAVAGVTAGDRLVAWMEVGKVGKRVAAAAAEAAAVRQEGGTEAGKEEVEVGVMAAVTEAGG